jgi:hypothetical protein
MDLERERHGRSRDAKRDQAKKGWRLHRHFPRMASLHLFHERSPRVMVLEAAGFGFLQPQIKRWVWVVNA